MYVHMFLPADNTCAHAYLPVAGTCAHALSAGRNMCTCIICWQKHVHMFLTVDNACAYVPGSRNECACVFASG